MLTRIFIQNFALIDHLDISLFGGLQVITGETGAGKSIILGALRLILGERADAKSISDASVKSVVEAEFKISENFKDFFDENDLDFDEQTIIRREILPNGKSRAFINDVPVTLDVLKEVSGKLVDIHSQFETSNLFNEEYQFSIIDGLSDNTTLIATYQKEFQAFKNNQKTLQQLQLQLAEGNKESDYKNFLLAELQEAQLDDLDFAELQSQISMQENSGFISQNLGEILVRLQQDELGILASLTEVKNKLQKIAEVAPHFSEISNRVETCFIELKDLETELEKETEHIEINPMLMESLQQQNNQINNLFLKHQVTEISDLIVIKNRLESEQSNFVELENLISKTQKELSEQEQSLTKFAEKLAENRKKSTPIFKEKIESLLQKLGLEKAKIEVESTSTSELTKFGKEKIQLLFQANSGFPLKPIQSAISGGERSRVMLAIKKLMAENAELPTLILDEIDTGVSGKIADEMGKVMKEMSADMQLIVITHLAQVAAKGDHNYKVIKEDISGKTQTKIVSLNPKEKLQEIAQLLSGSQITDAAIKQAEELMK